MKMFLQINVSKKKRRESYSFNYSFNYFKDKSLDTKKE